MKVIIFLLILFPNYTLLSQSNKGDTCIYDIEIDSLVLKSLILKEWNTITIDSSTYVKVFLYDCKGAMIINFYNSKGEKYCEGQYSQSLDTLKYYIYDIDPNIGCVIPSVYKYFKPLKKGTWYF